MMLQEFTDAMRPRIPFEQDGGSGPDLHTIEAQSMSEVANFPVECEAARPRWPMVVVTPVNLLWDPGSAELHAMVRQAARLLIDADIPIILVASSVVREPEHIQRELGIVHPYLSDGGAILHIPYGYFGGGHARSGAGWEMMTFVARGFGVERPSGLRFLLQTYRSLRSDIVTIGFGVTSSDRSVLDYVDFPVIVRNRNIDQNQLRRTFPDAFVTACEGHLGWGEAILGRVAYESDETGMMASVS